MKFGKRLQSQIDETLPEWRDKFLSYKHLKKRLKLLSAPECFTEAAFDAPSPTCSGSTEEDCTSVVDAAVQELRRESEGVSISHLQLPLRSEEDFLGTKSVSSFDFDLGGASEKSKLEGEISHREGNLGPDSPGKKSNSATPGEEQEKSARSVRKASGNDQLTEEEADFVHLLNVELEKFNTFFIEKEEEYVIRLQELKERIEELQEKSGPSVKISFRVDFINEKLIQIRKDM
ncbi:hypothetical protein O6H91_15G046300 [Diphasiastrum complanatum]|uniref:Uncharacterized protein n=1 Tax=Diphasiastrum complanatum TaxID=34168 RepID=A0ACC2BHX8_DIPCM|nr:hypothetical protein O6H91_15G046300 [Diphasiastrum complanatum]